LKVSLDNLVFLEQRGFWSKPCGSLRCSIWSLYDCCPSVEVHCKTSI